MSRRSSRALAALAAGAAALSVAPAALAGPDACSTRVKNTHAKLAECVTLDGVREHQTALQPSPTPTRATGSPAPPVCGLGRIRRAALTPPATPCGPAVRLHDFFPLRPAVLERVSPAPVARREQHPQLLRQRRRHRPVTRARAGADAPPGCDAADFAGFPAGNVALISAAAARSRSRRQNADAAGAVGRHSQQHGGDAQRHPRRRLRADIPVTSATHAVGAELAGTPGLVLHVKTRPSAAPRPRTTCSPRRAAGDDGNVVMVGAHLDSVTPGPASTTTAPGRRAILEVAAQLGKATPSNKVRFAWWGAEESAWSARPATSTA